MAKNQKRYSNEFKQQMVDLYSSKSIVELSGECYLKVLCTNGLRFSHLLKALTKIFRSKTIKLCKNRFKNSKSRTKY